jgi:redox-sensitive bicupin YhaK (pirin superfamily)
MITVTPREIDLAGFPVRRSLPTRAAREVGPWVFLDHIGPHTFATGRGVDVIPHPHINLATVTYLFDGEIVHRDSIGTVQAIRPGAINLMVAGRGIAHSERTSSERRGAPHGVHGVQLWHALPENHEEDEPSFHHYSADDLPAIEVGSGATARVMIGSAFGLSSPVRTYCRTLFAEVTIDGPSTIELPDDHAHLGVYAVSGRAAIGREVLPAMHLGVLDHGASALKLSTDSPARLVLIGGEPLGKRYMWWNFVSSRIDRIEQAKIDWSEHRFGDVMDDTDERTPLPEQDSHSRMKEQRRSEKKTAAHGPGDTWAARERGED